MTSEANPYSHLAWLPACLSAAPGLGGVFPGSVNLLHRSGRVPGIGELLWSGAGLAQFSVVNGLACCCHVGERLPAELHLGLHLHEHERRHGGGVGRGHQGKAVAWEAGHVAKDAASDPDHLG